MLLKGIGIRKVYESDGKKVEVLKGIDFEMDEGEFVSIVGPSGVGKSTFLHIMGLLDVPTNGEVFVYDKPVPFGEDRRANLRNSYIGFVFQHHFLLNEFSALENVAIPCLIAGEPAESAFAKAEEILGLVGLSHRLSHRPSELSGGEQQRVALARALVKSPKIVIADEPTGNLDRERGREIARIMLEVNRDKGIAFLVATHDLELAEMAQKIYVMEDGLLRHGG